MEESFAKLRYLRIIAGGNKGDSIVTGNLVIAAIF